MLQQLQLQDDLTEQNLIDNQKIAHEQLLNIGQRKTQRQDDVCSSQ